MKLKEPSISSPYILERVFKIKRIKNKIDLSDSFYVINKTISPALFDSEIYKITFSTKRHGEIRSYEVFISGNELISDQEADFLKEYLGITIYGDGSQFEIQDYQTDFTIQFDQENSSFAESEGAEKGLVLFKK